MNLSDLKPMLVSNTRKRKDQSKESILIKNLLNKKYKIKEISKKLNLSIGTIESICRKYEISHSSRRKVNINYFNSIDTENKAYILGFIIADGNIEVVSTGNKLNFFISSIDDYILEKIKTEICPEAIIKYTNNQQGVKVRKPQSRLRI